MIDSDIIFARNVRAGILLIFFMLPAIQFYYRLPMSIGYILAIFGIVYWIALFVYCERALSRVDKSNFLYLEKTASGYSHLNILTRLGGARNCLKIQLTNHYLTISSWFPFSLIAPLYDGVHIIPVEHIVSITPKKKLLWWRGYLLSFRTAETDHVSTFSLYPRNTELFESAFGKYMPT